MRISASLLSSDLLNLESEIKLLKQAGVNAIHIDIMDGHFVPNIAFGIDIVKQIGNVSELPITVHLMIDNPEKFIDVISYYKVDYLVVHSEKNRNVEALFDRIRDKGIGIGLAINPQTKVSDIKRYLSMVDLALIMGVHPGFGGQTLIISTIDKIKQIKAIRKDVIVGIDGGINGETVSLLANKEKPDIIIVGSYLFDGNRENRLDSIKEKLKFLCSRE